MTGCETPYGTPDRTGTGALAGGAIGAFSGAVIGGRHAGEGALIGGAIGAITGGLIGHSMDQEERERLRAEAPQTYVRFEQGQPLAVADVKAMVSAHVGDNVIISQIQSTRSVYHLSAADIIDLHDAGVSETVIQYMVNTANTANTAIPAPPVPQGEEVTQAPPRAADRSGSRGAGTGLYLGARRMAMAWRMGLDRRLLGTAPASQRDLGGGLLDARTVWLAPHARTLAVIV